MAILADENTKILIQGITGREATMVTKHTLDYGTPIIAGVTPGKEGEEVHGVPVYNTVKQACAECDLNAAIIYVPPAFAYDATIEAMENGLKLVLIMTERIPQQDVLKIIQIAQSLDCIVVGPNSVGIISPAEKIKMGAIGGDRVERCFVPGSVGVISRSGGMTAECSWMVKQAGEGVTTSVSIGGDSLIGSSPKKLLSFFEKDEKTKAVVMWSEPGTNFEEETAKFILDGEYTKPLISYVAGKFVEKMPEGTVFGHAASIIKGESGRPSNKIKALREAGAHVAETFNEIITILKSVLN